MRVLPAAEAAFRLVPAVPWDTPIDCHYQALTTCWHSAAAALSTEQQEQPVQAYLSEATLRIVHIRQALRRYLVDESREIRRRTCLIAFAAFLLHARHQQFTTRAAGVADHWLRSMDISEAVAVALLRWHGRQLRAAVAQDRRAYLDRLTRGHYTRPSAKPSRPPKLHAEATSFPLPILYRDDGTPANTSEERSTCWRRHFASQECGIDVTLATSSSPTPVPLPAPLSSSTAVRCLLYARSNRSC